MGVVRIPKSDSILGDERETLREVFQSIECVVISLSICYRCFVRVCEIDQSYVNRCGRISGGSLVNDQ